MQIERKKFMKCSKRNGREPLTKIQRGANKRAYRSHEQFGRQDYPSRAQDVPAPPPPQKIKTRNTPT